MLCPKLGKRVGHLIQYTIGAAEQMFSVPNETKDGRAARRKSMRAEAWDYIQAAAAPAAAAAVLPTWHQHYGQFMQHQLMIVLSKVRQDLIMQI